MKMKVFTVFDRAADAFMTPFFQSSRGLALRAFAAAIEDSNHEFSKHAVDYRLYEIGFYDDKEGRLTPLDEIELVATGSDYVKVV